MNEPTEVTPITQNTQVNVIPDKNNIFDPNVFAYCERLANIMAESSLGIPDEFKRKPSDIFGIVLKGLQWNINPYNLIDQCFVLQGKLSYSAKLIIALVNSQAPIEGELDFEWHGDWDKIQGKFKMVPSKTGKSTYPQKQWTDADEQGLSCTVSAKMKNTGKVKELNVKLTQAGVRNSTLWATDPRQQLAYLAAKRWASLFAPGVVLGFNTVDDIVDEEPREKDITPRNEKEAIKEDILNEVDKAATPTQENEPPTKSPDFLATEQAIAEATTLERLQEIRDCIPGLDLTQQEMEQLRNTYNIKGRSLSQPR